MNLFPSKVTIPFNFHRAAKRQPQEQKTPFDLMCWDDDTPRKLLSEDGYIMVATMPRLTDDRGTVRPLPPHLAAKDTDIGVCRLISPMLPSTMLNMPYPMLANLLPVLTKLASMLTDLEKSVAKFVLPKGGLRSGKRHVIIPFDLTLFSNRDTKHKGMVVPSSDCLKSGGVFAKTAELYQKFDHLSKLINEAIQVVDPQFFTVLTELYKVAIAKHPSLAAWASVDSLLLEGRELLFNRRSGRHRDSQDPLLAYAGLYAAGNFTTGGCLYFPQLNLRVRLLPGDFVLIRGRVLEHEIEAWEGGQRISIPHFTHTSLWRNCGLENLVDL